MKKQKETEENNGRNNIKKESSLVTRGFDLNWYGTKKKQTNRRWNKYS